MVVGTRVFLFLSAAMLASTPVWAGDLPGGAGRDIIMKSCNGCHKAIDIAQYRMARPEWVAAVERMSRRGAGLTSEEAETVAEYLASNFPKVEDPNKVNVNKASAKQLEDGLG